MTKTISVDIGVSLDHWTDEELREELEERGVSASLQRVYEYYYTSPNIEAPQVLKDHIYQLLGKTLSP